MLSTDKDNEYYPAFIVRDLPYSSFTESCLATDAADLLTRLSEHVETKEW